MVELMYGSGLIIYPAIENISRICGQSWGVDFCGARVVVRGDDEEVFGAGACIAIGIGATGALEEGDEVPA